MTIETLHFQHYFYQKYLQSTSTTKRVTYWVRLDQDIERHRLMYALLDVVQHQPQLRATFKHCNDQLRINVREFFPFIQIKEVNQCSKKVDITTYLNQESVSYTHLTLPTIYSV